MSARSDRTPADPPDLIPPLLRGLVDDAAVFPPGSVPLTEALAAHREHRGSWYAALIGPLLAPTSAVGDLARLLDASLPRGGPPPAETELVEAGVVSDTGIDALPSAVDTLGALVAIRQVEAAVAKRGEDPGPGLRRLLTLASGWPGTRVYAEIPLTWGLLNALDTVALARTSGLDVAAKFRTGGLAAELFPTPVELAAVMCACRDRDIPFKLTAGLHHAVRHTDPETGFIHHGFLNVLVGAGMAADLAEVAEVAEALANIDPVPLVEAGRARRDRPRSLWTGFGSCSVREPLTDMIRLGLVEGGYQ